MTNSVKHSGASEVNFELRCRVDGLAFVMTDNGKWKAQEKTSSHFGIASMQARAQKNSFKMDVSTGKDGTAVSVQVPLIEYKSDL